MGLTYPSKSVSGNSFKNKIINGDFRLDYIGGKVIENDEDYFVNRWCSRVENGKIEYRRKAVYNDNSVSTIDIVDPFEDDSGIALYHYDGDASDVSGKHDATTHGGISYDNGFFNKGLVFCDESEKQYVDTDEITETKSAFTVTGWVDGDTGDNGTYAYILAPTDSGAQYGFNVRFSNDSNANKADIHIGGDYKRVDLGIILDPKDKFFFAYYWDKTKNDGKAYLYIKNLTKGTEVLVDTDDVTQRDDLDNGITVIAGVPSTYSGRRKILLDQERIFNRVLTKEEIDKIYNEVLYNVREYYAQATIKDKDDDFTAVCFIQKFESQVLNPLQKQNVTLSFDFASSKTGKFKVKFIDFKGNELSQLIDYENDNNDFERFSLTFDLSNVGDDGEFYLSNDYGGEIQIAVFDDSDDIVSLDVDNWVKVKKVQFEKGNIATDFEIRPIQIETMLCNRYIAKSSVESVTDIKDIISMRVTPTIDNNILDAEL